jgi:hypothetical protein
VDAFASPSGTPSSSAAAPTSEREYRVSSAVTSRTGRGAGSGIEVDDDGWTVWTLNDDGLATRLEFFLDHQEVEALEAAGLSE